MNIIESPLQRGCKESRCLQTEARVHQQRERNTMFSITKVKSMKDGPYTSPVKAKVVATTPTKSYVKNGETKTWSEFSLADSTGIIKGVCYDPAKLSTLKEDNFVMIRNYIKRENTLIITSTTKASTTSVLPDVPQQHLEEAKQLLAPPPTAEEMAIVDAKKVPVNSLVTITGKVIRIDHVQTRTLRSQETVKVRGVMMKDSTGEVAVSLWRDLADAVIEIGHSYKVTDLKLNVYHGIQLNSLARTTLTKVETPAETVDVIVDGYFTDKEQIVLVCKLSNEDYVDYVCPPALVSTVTGNEENPTEGLADMTPFKAQLILSGNDTIEKIKKV